MPTLCTSGQALLKAGHGVDENFYSGSFVQTGTKCGEVISGLIVQAEGEVCTAGRRNFVGEYSGYTEPIKRILQQATSNLAAIYLIQYNLSGYTSRVEAEDMVNILRDGYLRCIGILRDKKAQTFIENAT